MSEIVLAEQLKPGVVGLTLNRPERRNALSIDLMSTLIDKLNSLASDGQCRVVILGGAGPVFCAGLDLAEAQDRSLVERSAGLVAETLHTVKFGPIVTIASVQGGAFAGGGGLVAACDIAVGSDDCRIGFPEARRGLLPALISNVLRSKVREGDLAELFLAGERITAARAQQVGILQRVVPASSLPEESLSLATSILAGGPQTIIETKRLLRQLYGHTAEYQGGAATSIDEHLKARFSAEAIEGLQAFLEKRPPKWLSDGTA